jgi:hypothetical protein
MPLIPDISVDKSPAEMSNVGIIQTEDDLDMANKTSLKPRKKAVKKLDKAVKRAVKKESPKKSLSRLLMTRWKKQPQKSQP